MICLTQNNRKDDIKDEKKFNQFHDNDVLHDECRL